MGDAEEGNGMPPYQDGDAAPFVYFDVIAALGVMGGAVQVELAARTLTPVGDNATQVKFRPTARLRCSPAAAAHLIESLQKALAMLQQPQEPPPVGSQLN